MALAAAIPLILKAAPTIMSIIGGLFGKKKKKGQNIPAQSFLPPEQQIAGQELSSFVQQYLNKFIPGEEYSGDFTAPLTDLEETGLGKLGSYLNAPTTGELFGVSKQNLLDTIGGKYANPETSPFIRSATNLSKINLRDAIDASRARRGARGSYFTDAALKEEGDITNKSLAYLDTIIGDFINQERGRQLQAIPQAAALEEYELADAPLKKVTASQTLGSLRRTLEQSDLERRYTDFKRQRDELGGVVDVAQGLYSPRTAASRYFPGGTTPDVEQNSTLGTIMDIISKLNLSALSKKGSIFEKLAGILKPQGA